MWLSQQKRSAGQPGGWANVGRVTLPGNPAGVYLAGERRDLPVFGPGGYCWRPAEQQQVLVIQSGADGELACIVGGEDRGSDPGLAPGEVCIRAAKGPAAVYIRQDGSIRLNGQVYINEVPLSDLFGGIEVT